MISFCGIDLVHPTAELRSWLNAKISTSKAFGFYRPKALEDKLNPRAHFAWVHERGVQLNTFYNPWGASRFGVAYVLADDAMLDAIGTEVYGTSGTEYNAGDFVLSDGLTDSITTSLFMLPSVPLAQIDGTPVLGLNLLVLVDERYFWWEKAVNLTSFVENTQSYGNIYGDVGTAIGVTIDYDSIAGGYFNPSRFVFRKNIHIPLLLDWIAMSCGQRIVRTLAGAIKTINATTGLALASTQLSSFKKIAGGELNLNVEAAANVPASVVVTFPRMNNPESGTLVHTETVTLAGLALDEYDGDTGRSTVQLINSSLVTPYVGSLAPVNSEEATQLAEQIATDFYLWRLAPFEVRFHQPCAWVPDGLHDIEYAFFGDITTAIHRSEWEPEYGELLNSGQFGSRHGLQYQLAPFVRIVDGELAGGKFSCFIRSRDNINLANDDINVSSWAMDLFGATVLTADDEYLSEYAGIETGGPQYMSIVDDNTGNDLTSTPFWIPLLSDPTAPLAFVDSIVDAVDIADGAQTVVSGSAPTDFASFLDLIIVDSDVSITAGTVEIVGTDSAGGALDETIDISSGGSTTYTTAGSFRTVTSVTVAGLTGEAAGDTIQLVIHEYPVGVLRTSGGDTYLTIAPISPVGGTVWNDACTDADGTDMTSHTPDVSPGGAGYTVSTGVWQIQSNKATPTTLSGGSAIIRFDPGTTDQTFSTVLYFNDNNTTSMGFFPRATSAVLLALVKSGGGPTWFVSLGDGVTTDTDSTTLNTTTPYTLTIVDDGINITATVGTASVTISSSVGITNTPIQINVSASGTQSVSFDDINVDIASSGAPPAAGWLLVVPVNRTAYSDLTTYAKGDYLREVRSNYAFESNSASISTSPPTGTAVGPFLFVAGTGMTITAGGNSVTFTATAIATGTIVTDPATGTATGPDYTFKMGYTGTILNVVAGTSEVDFNIPYAGDVPSASPSEGIVSYSSVYDGSAVQFFGGDKGVHGNFFFGYETNTSGFFTKITALMLSGNPGDNVTNLGLGAYISGSDEVIGIYDKFSYILINATSIYHASGDKQNHFFTTNGDGFYFDGRQTPFGGGPSTIDPVVNISKNGGGYDVGQTATTGGLNFRSGWYVGGTLAIGVADGGTGVDSSGSTGIAHVAAGTWTFSAVDLSTSDVTGIGTLDKGMTGADLSATGPGVVIQTGAGSALSVSQGGTYTPSNVTPDFSYDADATTIDELADILGTLIADLQALKIIQ